MATRIAMFNHKGGVSKTTTTFNLGWMLATQGHRVILVDADPQCNLTGLILGYQAVTDFESFYADESDRNIRAGLAPAFESQPRSVEAVDCLPVDGNDGLFLLPGHIRLSEYEVTLGIAQQLSGTIQTLQNLPGSITHLLDQTAAKFDADFVIVDMNPSLSALNQNVLMTSDYFIVPTSPDYFSVMAIESLLTVLPRWHAWSQQAQSAPILQEAAYPFPTRDPRFLGTIIQKYRPRSGAPTVGFQKWIDAINDRVKKGLVPALRPLSMTLTDEQYSTVELLTDDFCLALVADFNTLIAKSQEAQTPVFALTDAQMGHVGTVLEADRQKRDEFHQIFSTLAERVVALTNAGSTSAVSS